MPLYQQDEQDLLTVEFPDGNSLTLILRPDGVTVESSRIMARKQKYAEYAATQIQKREEKLAKADELSAEEFDKLTAELKQWQERPDNADFMIDFVFQAASGWKDYYPNREAEQKQELLPYTRENVAKIYITRLGKIVEALNKRFGWSEEEEKKAENSSPSVSLLAEKESDTRTSMFKES
jgi:hypothetical protein